MKGWRRSDFEWDSGNRHKSAKKHDVTDKEAGEIFRNLNELVPLGKQVEPRAGEDRFGALGMTDKGRKVMIAFKIRQGVIRVISARPMSEKERKFYDEVCKE